MLHKLKLRLYFVVAAYFGFWAKLVLLRWRPRIIVVTGSSGKTSTLHMIEAQLGAKATYSHHANSAIGIPFNILGLKPNVPSKSAWLKYILVAPFHIFRKLPKQKLYIVESDCDRPKEGRFSSKLLKPEVLLWVSVYRTHSMNFDKLVKNGQFPSHEAAIAHEFGYFVSATQKLVIANGDQPDLVNELKRAKRSVAVKRVSLARIDRYQIKVHETVFGFNGQTIQLPGVQPKELAIGLQMVNQLLDYLGLGLDQNYSRYQAPPGRSSVFKGSHHITIIDSTYNTGLGAMNALLNLFDLYPSKSKWLVIGDILEQGSVEQQEHEKLAYNIATHKLEHIILLGPRIKKYSYPILKQAVPQTPISVFESPKEVLDYLNANLKGGETVLFKGARGLEGVIEQLLADPKDQAQLVRRESADIKRRQAWGLPK